MAQLIPDRYFRKGILTSFNSMLPSSRFGFVVSIEDYQKRKLLDGKAAQECIGQLLRNHQTNPDVVLGYITGSVIEMKFQEHRFSLKLLNTNRSIAATYSDEHESILLDHPRDLIQVHGNIVYDENEFPVSISDVDEILEIDENPIKIFYITFNDKILNANKPLIFIVKFDRESNLYEIDGDFGILIGAETRPELEAQLFAELDMLWREYALAEPVNMTNGALKLRECLLTTFREETNAS